MRIAPFDFGARTSRSLLGLDQGRRTKGAPADVILVDLEEDYVFNVASLRSKSRNSPFDGSTKHGRVKCTIIGGETVFEG